MILRPEWPPIRMAADDHPARHLTQKCCEFLHDFHRFRQRFVRADREHSELRLVRATDQHTIIAVADRDLRELLDGCRAQKRPGRITCRMVVARTACLLITSRLRITDRRWPCFRSESILSCHDLD